jgi:hypothetical protein
MRSRRIGLVGFIALGCAALACAPACSSAHERSPGERRGLDAPRAELAAVERLLGGEWRVAYPGGASQFDTWSWGPGRHSLRLLTDGSSGEGTRWQAFGLVYWHPGLAQLRTFGMNPYAQSVAHGVIRADSELIETELEMHQSGGLRHLRLRQAFDGPDAYRATLAESVAPADYATLAEWDYARALERSAPPNVGAPERERVSVLKAFEVLAGRTWSATEAQHPSSARVQIEAHWMPQVDAFFASAFAGSAAGESLLHAYVYAHPADEQLRLLALSSTGAVYEGGVAVLDGDRFELALTAHEGERERHYAMQIELASDGSLRERVWSVAGATRELLRDRRHAPSAAAGE